MKEPDFSTTVAIGRTTSARSVIALGRISSESTNALSRPVISGACISNGSTPPTTSASIAPFAALARIPAPSRPIVFGNESTDQAAATSTRAAASEIGRPPGRRFPIAPASSAPRSPARRGTHAIFAPLLAASCATADSAPTDSQRRSPTTITDSLVRASCEIACASVPGTTPTYFACSFLKPRVCQGAIAVTANARWRTCLRILRKTIGDSSSGSIPTRTT
ncbi:unannotated protein [freshwater metagenome]|uniref:Unannotated protein n=1 Tax=freshwater metagenome TaxID=449393 RepID=A0A6J6CZM5_9ZZZZ